ncbi:CapA family protein [Arsukibacterium perlucidum]|uniref:CapA family protein n=1 Tax=Arsukibacterium perlucidum TaxID=368811 RepID=UPI0003770F93|nr:CapA family protein [Arsukibacterium perlucidum]
MISIAFTGDLCLSGVKEAPPATVTQAFCNIHKLLKPYDLAVMNLECSLSLIARPELKMNIPFDSCPPLSDLSNGVYCLANNHVKDSGPQALLQMLDFMRQNKVDTVGAAENASRAYQPLLKNIHGIQIAIVNVTDASHYAATAKEPGVARLRRRALLRQVQQLSSEVDAVIVVIHADLEFSNYPSPWRVRLSRKLAQYCKLVIHHHSHTLQGIEHYKGCVIAYSLGNFVFPVQESAYMHNRTGGVNEGMILVAGLELTSEGVKASVLHTLPTRIGRWGFLLPVSETDAQQTLRNLSCYSVVLSDTKALRQHHASLCYNEARNVMFNTWYRMRRGQFREAFSYLFWHLKTDQHRNWLRGAFSFGWW